MYSCFGLLPVFLHRQYNVNIGNMIEVALQALKFFVDERSQCWSNVHMMTGQIYLHLSPRVMVWN
jgi:hypothetical protein